MKNFLTLLKNHTYTTYIIKLFTLNNIILFTLTMPSLYPTLGSLNYNIYPAVLFTYILGPTRMLCNIT